MSGEKKLSKKTIMAIIAVVLILGMIGACRDSINGKDNEFKTTRLTTTVSFTTTVPTTVTTTTVTTTEVVTETETEATTERVNDAIVAESGYDYVVNTNTGKFHYSYCSQADRIKSENKAIIHGTSEELQDRGYSPCGKCNP